MSADIDYSFDGDWGNDDYWGEFGPYDFTSASLRNRTHISQEFRLLSNETTRLFNDSTDWLVGLYYLGMDEDNSINELSPGESLKHLFKVGSLPWYDENDLQKSLDFCDDLLQEVKTYELNFRPGPGIVDDIMSFVSG